MPHDRSRRSGSGRCQLWPTSSEPSAGWCWIWPTIGVEGDLRSHTFDLDPGDWVLHTLNGQEISGANHSSAPTAIGTADVTGHVEGVIPFTDYSSPTRLADDASLSLVQLISTASTPDTITGQWNWPQPVAVEALPTVEK